MEQALGCCAICCPCLRGREARALAAVAAVPAEEAEDSKSRLLPSSSRKPHKALVGKRSSKHKRPPSHLRELSGDINQVVRLVLVGGCDTGKTCLLRRFLGGYFDEAGQQDYTRTLGVDFGCKTIELADRRVRLQMWDTGGSETYRSVVSHYLRGADGVILCFDVNRKATLRALRSVWAPFLDKHTPRTCRVLLAGNKADCRGDSRAEGAEVFPEDAKRFADAVEAQVFETSAKLGTNVDVAVLALMREVLHHRQFAVPEKTRSDEKGVSPRRKGRKRLSVALRNVMESGSEGDAASCDDARCGEVRRSSQTHEADDTVTEGTSSAASSSSSQRDGDSSDQSSSNGKKSGIQGRTWDPFPTTDDLTEDSKVERSTVDGGLNTTGGTAGGAIMGSRHGRTGGGGRPSNAADVKRQGRYHFVNQLVLAAPSRAKTLKNTDTNGDGSGCGGGGGGGVAGDGENSVRGRCQNVHDGFPEGNRRDGRSCIGVDDSRLATVLPRPGAAANASATNPQGPIAVCHTEPSSPAAEDPPSLLHIDDRRRPDGGRRTRVGEDASLTAVYAESIDADAFTTGGCSGSLSRLSPAGRPSVASQPIVTGKKTPREVQRQPQRSVQSDVKDVSGGCGGEGDLGWVLARTSSSSSFTTVVVGDTSGPYREVLPVREEV